MSRRYPPQPAWSIRRRLDGAKPPLAVRALYVALLIAALWCLVLAVATAFGWLAARLGL